MIHPRLIVSILGVSSVLIASGLVLHFLPEKIATAQATTTPTWYSPEWPYRQLLSINPTSVAEELSDFPVLIKITDPQAPIFKFAQARGEDLLFTNADGFTPLAHEIELFSPATHELTAWVTIPHLSSRQSTPIYLYFGHNKATPIPSSHSTVWSNRYTSVYLMNQGPQYLGLHDATTPHLPLKIRGQSQETVGQVGVALKLNGATNAIDLTPNPQTNLLPPFTISAWIKPSRATGTIIGKRAGDVQQWQFFTYGPGTLQIKEDNTGRWPGHQSGTQETTITLNEWQHVAVTIDNTGTPTFYRNGVSEAGTYHNGTFIEQAVPASIGARWTRYPDISYQFAGEIDDIRLSNTVRSFGWLKTEYMNQKYPDRFVTIGPLTSQESPTPLPLPFHSSTSHLNLLPPTLRYIKQVPQLYYAGALLSGALLITTTALLHASRRLPKSYVIATSSLVDFVKTVDVQDENSAL